MLKRLVIVMFIIFGCFLTFSLYRTFAYDTSVVEETPSTTDLEYTFKIGNSSIKQITVESGETKYYDVVLGNPNPAKISYGVYYEMVSPSTKPDNFTIFYTSNSSNDSQGKVDKESSITLNIVVTNKGTSSVTVKLGSVSGYVNGGELLLQNGQTIIKRRAVDYVESLNDDSNGQSGSGVYKINHDAIPASESATGSEIPAVTDYRYYGKSPNNYVLLPDMNESEEYCSYDGEQVRKNANCKTVYKITGSENSGDYFYIDEIVETDFVASSGSMNWNNGKCLYNDNEISSEYGGTISEDICNKLSVLNNGTEYYSALLEKMGSPDTSKNGLYRIVGSIYNELAGTNELKLVKDFPLTDGTNYNFAWNLTKPEDNSQYYEAIWAPLTDTSNNFSNATEISGITSGSTLMQMLNSKNKDVGYFWNRTSGNVYYKDNNTGEFKTVNVNFEKYGLSESTKKLIDMGRYYLGFVDEGGVPSYYAYIFERSSQKYNAGSPLYWDGEIGLLYFSDNGYGCGHLGENDEPICSDYTSWLNFFDGYWGITNLDWKKFPQNVWMIGFQDPNVYFGTFIGAPVKPSFYLKSDVYIASGDGSKDNPYRLSLD